MDSSFLPHFVTVSDAYISNLNHTPRTPNTAFNPTHLGTSEYDAGSIGSSSSTPLDLPRPLPRPLFPPRSLSPTGRSSSRGRFLFSNGSSSDSESLDKELWLRENTNDLENEVRKGDKPVSESGILQIFHSITLCVCNFPVIISKLPLSGMLDVALDTSSNPSKALYTYQGIASRNSLDFQY